MSGSRPQSPPNSRGLFGTPRTGSARPRTAASPAARISGTSSVPSRVLSARSASKKDVDKSGGKNGRVRVAVRLRPVLPFEVASVGDSASVIEVESEVNRVVVKRDHWDSDAYQLDSAYPPSTSQRRLYEEFCAPVVDSVLKGYNGTVMAYGQTGTGKTYTLGNLGTGDSSQRGIVVRAMEHILGAVRDDVLGQYKLTLSYLQLYMEAVLDLLEPEKDGLAITEDPTTGEVICNGAKVIDVNNMEGLLRILKIGEDNRVVANQKLNATSSRSHSLLIITVRRLPKDSKNSLIQSVTALKGKLLLVDLAGSERISKSGSEGHMLEEAKFINLSLTALGKCIYALTDVNPAHIPYRDSKLTRLLKDSFGGSARTSLIVNISPLRAHISETSSALQFGQRALKIENNTRIREEVDLKLLTHKLQVEMDKLHVENERANEEVVAATKELSAEQAIRGDLEAALALTEQKLLQEKGQTERVQMQYRQLMTDQELKFRGEMDVARSSADAQKHMMEGRLREMETQTKAMEQDYYKEKQAALTASNKLAEYTDKLETDTAQHRTLQQKLDGVTQQLTMKESLVAQLEASMTASSEQKEHMHATFLQEARQESKMLEKELVEVKEVHQKETEASAQRIKALQAENAQMAAKVEESASRGVLPEENDDRNGKGGANSKFWKVNSKKETKAGEGGGGQVTQRSEDVLGPSGTQGVWTQHRDAVSAVSKLFEHVGLTTVFGLLKYDDRDVRLHAVKVIANLAAEEENQVNIVQEGGLEALFELLHTCTDEMTLRVAAGAVANLAMSEANQHRIVEEGGLELLVKLSKTAHDSQTQRMIAGAVANLCGNANILDKLHESGSLMVLVHLSTCEHVDVLSQVARGFANNSKCTKGKTHLVELGALPAILHLASKKSLNTVRKHAMLALCQIASCPENIQAVRASGAFALLKEISTSEWDEFKQMASTVVSNPMYSNQ